MANKINERLEMLIVVHSMDFDYKVLNRADQIAPKHEYNFDHPDAIASGDSKSRELSIYNIAIHANKFKLIYWADILISEAILSFQKPEIFGPMAKKQIQLSIEFEMPPKPPPKKVRKTTAGALDELLQPEQMGLPMPMPFYRPQMPLYPPQYQQQMLSAMGCPPSSTTPWQMPYIVQQGAGVQQQMAPPKQRSRKRAAAESANKEGDGQRAAEPVQVAIPVQHQLGPIAGRQDSTGESEMLDWLDEAPPELRAEIRGHYELEQAKLMPEGLDKIEKLSAKTGLTSLAYLWFKHWMPEVHRLPWVRGQVAELVQPRQTLKDVEVIECPLTFGYAAQSLAVYSWSGIPGVEKLLELKPGMVVEFTHLPLKRQDEKATLRRGSLPYKCYYNGNSSVKIVAMPGQYQMPFMEPHVAHQLALGAPPAEQEYEQEEEEVLHHVIGGESPPPPMLEAQQQQQPEKQVSTDSHPVPAGTPEQEDEGEEEEEDSEIQVV